MNKLHEKMVPHVGHVTTIETDTANGNVTLKCLDCGEDVIFVEMPEYFVVIGEERHVKMPLVWDGARLIVDWTTQEVIDNNIYENHYEDYDGNEVELDNVEEI